MHIYKIKNLINKKIYIGLSTYDGPQRWDKHRYNATRNAIHHIDRAINKYGAKNFKYEIIEKIPFKKGIKFLENREIFYIKKFKSNNSKIGYNRSLGGNVNVAKKVTKTQKLKASINQRVKKVFCFDLNGKFVEEFRNINIAAKKLSRTKAAISRVINKKNRTCADKQWRTFKNDIPPKKIDKLTKIEFRKTIPVYQWSKTGKLIAKHSSKAEACRKAKTNPASVHRVLKGINMYAGGYHFTLEEKFIRPRKKIVISGPTESRRIPVNIYSSEGKLIETIKGMNATSKKYGVSLSMLYKTLANNSVAQKKGKNGNYYQFTKFNKIKKIKPIINFRSLKPMKPVLSYSLKGKFLKKFDNLSIAAKFYKTQRSSIRRSANQNNYKCGNHLFRWFNGKILNKIKPYKKMGTPVLQYHFNGNFIKEYSSIVEASKAVNINPASIRLCVIGRGYSSAGYYWFKKTNKNIKKKIKTPIPI